MQYSDGIFFLIQTHLRPDLAALSDPRQAALSVRTTHRHMHAAAKINGKFVYSIHVQVHVQMFIGGINNACRL